MLNTETSQVVNLQRTGEYVVLRFKWDISITPLLPIHGPLFAPKAQRSPQTKGQTDNMLQGSGHLQPTAGCVVVVLAQRDSQCPDSDYMLKSKSARIPARTGEIS